MKAIISIEREAARRRRAMKVWLRKHGVAITPYMRYNHTALRKAIRDRLAGGVQQ